MPDKPPYIVYTKPLSNKGEYEVYSVSTDEFLGKIKGDSKKKYWEAFDKDGKYKYCSERKKQCMDYFRELDKERIMAQGGGIGFEKLSKQIAKNYEGKKVAPKYQHEYGKTYSKSEAQEVGDKVAGKVYWQQQGRKMATGGGTSARQLVVLDEGNGKVINNLFNDWTKIKSESEQEKWNEKVRLAKFGTYGTISIFEVLDKFDFDKASLNEVVKRDFKKEINNALKYAKGGSIDLSKRISVIAYKDDRRATYFVDEKENGYRIIRHTGSVLMPFGVQNTENWKEWFEFNTDNYEAVNDNGATTGKKNHNEYAEGGEVLDKYLARRNGDDIDNKMLKAIFRAYGDIDNAFEFKFYDPETGVAPYRLVYLAIIKGFITPEEITKELLNSAYETSSETADAEEIGSSDMNYYVWSMLRDAGFDMKVENGYYVRVGNKMATGGNTPSADQYIRKSRERQAREEEGKYFARYRAFVYSGSDQFADFKGDDFHKAVTWAKQTLEKQKAYRKSSESLWAIVDEFTPIEERGNVIYPYKEVARFTEENTKNMKFATGGSMSSGMKTYYIILNDGSQKEFTVANITEIPNIYFSYGRDGLEKGTPMVHYENALNPLFNEDGTYANPIPEYAGKDYWEFKNKMATGGQVEEPQEYYRVFRNNAGKDVAVKILKNPIFGKYDYYVDGTLRGQFDTFAQARQEVNYENFDMYKRGGGLGRYQVSGTKSGYVDYLPNKKYQIKKDVANAETRDYNTNSVYTGVVLPKGSIVNNLAGGVFVVNEKLKVKYPTIYIEKYGLPIIRKSETLNEILNNSEILEYERGGMVSNYKVGDIIVFENWSGDEKEGEITRKVDRNNWEVWYGSGLTLVENKNILSKQTAEDKKWWFFEKGGLVVTSIKDIPNFKEELEAGRITYRGLGMGKLSSDFYKIAGEGGTRIKVNGKEYYITDTEFDTFNRDSSGKMRIKFDAPFRKFETGGGVSENRHNLKVLEGSWQSYNKGVMSGKKDDGYITIKNENDLRDYIKDKLGSVVKSIVVLEKGKKYPYNQSNPYSHDTYFVTLKDGTQFNIQRQYGVPNWSGNVDYTERISIETIKYAKGGGVFNSEFYKKGGSLEKEKYAYVQAETTSGNKVFKFFEEVPTHKEVYAYFRTVKDEHGNPITLKDTTIHVEEITDFDRESFLEKANEVAISTFGSPIKELDDMMFSFDKHNLSVFKFEAELENGMEVSIQTVDGVIVIEAEEDEDKFKDGGSIDINFKKDTDYIKRENIKLVKYKNGKELYNWDYWDSYNVPAEKDELFSGIYVAHRPLPEKDADKQYSMFKAGGKLPETAFYIKRSDIDSVVVYDENKGEEIEIPANRIVNGIWFDNQRTQLIIDRAKKEGLIPDKTKKTTTFIARFNGKKIELEAKSTFDAEQKAMKELKVPKSKRGLLSVMSKQAYERGDFQFN